MPKKTTKPAKATRKAPKPKLTPKLINFPPDWVEAIDAQRGEVSFGDFVRNAVLNSLDIATASKLCEMPGWGHGRWKK